MADHDTNLIGIKTDFVQQGDDIVRKHTQQIPQWHLDALKEQRNSSTQQREGEFMRVASIPVAVIEKWRREGFDVLTDKNITGPEIVARLKSENLDAFLTTDKSI